MDAEKKQTDAAKIKQALDLYRDQVAADNLNLGIRVLDIDYPLPAVGDTLDNSYEWIDDEQTDNEYPGTAVFDANFGNCCIDTAINYFADPKAFCIVSGHNRGSYGMPEQSARIFSDCKVLAIIPC